MKKIKVLHVPKIKSSLNAISLAYSTFYSNGWLHNGRNDCFLSQANANVYKMNCVISTVITATSVSRKCSSHNYHANLYFLCLVDFTSNYSMSLLLHINGYSHVILTFEMRHDRSSLHYQVLLN